VSTPCTPSRPRLTAGSLVLQWLRPGTDEIMEIVCYQDAIAVAFSIGQDLGDQIVGAYNVRPRLLDKS
jgi:hypothetical protein